MVFDLSHLLKKYERRSMLQKIILMEMSFIFAMMNGVSMINFTLLLFYFRLYIIQLTSSFGINRRFFTNCNKLTLTI